MPVNPAPQTPVERSLVITPPVKGWNTRDPKSNMDPEYSPGIENFFPGNGVVALRNGFTQHVKTAAGNGYGHLDELVNTAGTHFLIAFTAGGVLYNVTAVGAGTAITGGFSTASAENYTVNFRGRLYGKGYVNTNDILSTDGTAATLAAFTGPGGDDKDLWRLATYKSRMYALTVSDASMWYGGFDAITGAMTQFDFQSLFTLGGKPWYIGPFSMTGGDIAQEYFCVISEQGEVLLYQGDYPGSGGWGLVGHYFIPAPVGRQAFFNWASDIITISYDGAVSLREYIASLSGGGEYTFLTDAVSSAFKDEIAVVAANGSGYLHFIVGFVYPKGQYLIINFYNAVVPNGTNQFVMNTQTRAWTKFSGQRAICWSLLNNSLYFGAAYTGGSYIGHADNGYFDEDPDNTGSALTRTIKCRHAFNYFGDPTLRKKFVTAQPTMYQSEGMSITCDMDVDYTDTTATSTESDSSAGTSYQIYQPKCKLVGPSGNAGSFRIDGSCTTKRFSLEATKIIYNDGTIE